MDEFKCQVCGSTEYHTKEVGNGSLTDKILDLRNPSLNARITLKACAGCHIVFAYWEDFQTSDISQEEKDIANAVISKEDTEESPE